LIVWGTHLVLPHSSFDHLLLDIPLSQLSRRTHLIPQLTPLGLLSLMQPFLVSPCLIAQAFATLSSFMHVSRNSAVTNLMTVHLKLMLGTSLGCVHPFSITSADAQ
jgi:hypothetical protein